MFDAIVEDYKFFTSIVPKQITDFTGLNNPMLYTTGPLLVSVSNLVKKLSCGRPNVTICGNLNELLTPLEQIFIKVPCATYHFLTY